MVQLTLLTAVVKLFLHRPQSTQALVQKVLTKATQVCCRLCCLYVCVWWWGGEVVCVCVNVCPSMSLSHSISLQVRGDDLFRVHGDDLYDLLKTKHLSLNSLCVCVCV